MSEQEAIKRLRALIKFAAEDEVSSEGAADIRAIRALLDSHERMRLAIEEALRYNLCACAAYYNEKGHPEDCPWDVLTKGLGRNQ